MLINFYSSFYFIVCSLILYVECIPTYTILAPQVIRPHSDYNLIVAFDDILVSTEVTCKIVKQDGNSKESYTQEKTFDSLNKFQIIKLQIGLNWTPGLYIITVTGKGELNFEKQYQAEYIYKQFNLLFQSDKAIYKPGEDVQFRLLALDDSLKAANYDDINDLSIFVMDPQDIKLKQLFITKEENEIGLDKFSYSKGVTSDMTINIPEMAPNGRWKLQATTHGQIQNYTFFVEYYTLPLANVTIHLPDFVKLDEPTLNYRVDVFYTFGKPVNGIINITMEKVNECGRHVTSSDKWSLSSNISGQFNNSINIKDTSLYNPRCADMKINFTAVIYDEATNSIYYNYEFFDIIRNNIRAESEDKRLVFRPLKDVTRSILLSSRTTDTMNNDQLSKITCIAEYKTKNSTTYVRAEPVNMFNQNGKLFCDFKTDNSFSEMKIMVIDNVDSTEVIILEEDIRFLRECSDDYIQIKLQEPQKVLKSNDLVKFSITSNKVISDIIYYIVIRGSITNSSFYHFKDPSITGVLNIKMTREMVPEAMITVFMKSQDSNIIVSDTILIRVNGIYQHEVNITTMSPQIDPGESAKMMIESESTSRVFLLGEDVAVLALRQGNDINNKRILSELAFNNNFYNATESFIQTGMNIITNTINECKSDLYKIDIIDDNDDSDNVKHLAIRKDFRETWIWDKLQMPNSKSKIRIESNVPESITTWKVTAFALHDDKGLGITTNPAYITVFRQFFMKLNLPYSIKRGEMSDIHITVFNYLNETVSANVDVILNDTAIVENIQVSGCNQKIELKPNEIRTVTCSVIADKVGRFSLIGKVDGVMMMSNKKINPDGELKTLLVVYEGVVRYLTKTILFDLTEEDRNTVYQDNNIEFPEESINGSQVLLLSATTELISVYWQDRMNSIQKEHPNAKLDLKLPEACCQQRVILWFRVVYWLEYLIGTGKSTEDDIRKGSDAILRTVSLLCPQIPNDGSYVYYVGPTGDHLDNSVDHKLKSFLWQTAYTVKMLNHIKQHVLVDEKIISDSINWIKTKQNPSGEFIETDPEHSLFQTTNNAYLTSYVQITMNETGQVLPNALTWLSANFNMFTNSLDMMSSCYAMTLANHPFRDNCYATIEKLLKGDNSIGKYWLGTDNQPDLHITAYGLMLLTERRSIKNALDVFKFILSKQDLQGQFIFSNPNENKGFPAELNSYHTIICTEAMTKFVLTMKKYKPEYENVIVTFKTDLDDMQTLKLRSGAEVVQVIQANSKSKTLSIKASGFGMAKANILYQFNIKEDQDGHFNINATIRNRNENYILIDICTSHKTADVKNAIIELDLPSGYTYHSSDFNLNPKLVDKIEAKESDTHIIIYLKKIDQENLCLTIPAIESHEVKNRKPVPIKVYGYYDRSGMSVKHI